jgi:retron-type reverse transcriptase
MEEAVTPENHGKALRAVLRNDGAPGIDGMRTAELKKHLETHWEKIRAKLLAGTYVPTPVRRKEIEKPGGGVRTLASRVSNGTAISILSRFPQLTDARKGARMARPVGIRRLHCSIFSSKNEPELR